MSGKRPHEHDHEQDVVVRKAEHGWVVGEENVSDLTSAMVLADLFAADQAADETGLMQAVDENGQPRRPAAHAAPPSSGSPAPWPNVSGPQRVPTTHGPGVADKSGETGEAERLAVTVAQLEHALASRVRVEQAIGVLAERHRLRPRDAFDLLRKASRARGTRVTELAQQVVASAANPLLRLPDELSRGIPEPRQRGRQFRRGRHAADKS
jgi:ANTAR domain